MNLISLFVLGFLTENVVFTKFLGICPFVGTSNKPKNAFFMGIAVMLVVMIASIITFGFYHSILVPTDTKHLTTLIFIFTIASTVGILEMFIERFFPKIQKLLGIYLPLITTNCAVLGITLLNINNDYTFLQVLVFSFASSLGFSVMLYIFSTIRDLMRKRKGYAPFEGYPIALITAGIVALLFTRYIGIS